MGQGSEGAWSHSGRVGGTSEWSHRISKSGGWCARVVGAVKGVVGGE